MKERRWRKWEIYIKREREREREKVKERGYRTSNREKMRKTWIDLESERKRMEKEEREERGEIESVCAVYREIEKVKEEREK